MSNFGLRLNELMKTENLSTVKLKQLINISTTQLGRYLSGHYEPSLANVIKISNYFNCSIDYLLGIDDFKNQYKNFNNPNYEKFISRYQDLLKINNTNHNRISIDAKFNRNNLLYWQRNKKIPTLDILYKLAKILNTKVEYLIGRID